MKMRGLVTKGALVSAMSGLLLLSGGAAHASSGWDYKGDTKFYHGHYDDYTRDVYSTGGYVKVCITSAATEKEDYELWEHDAKGDGDGDDFITDVDGAGCYTFSNIGKYVDGHNGKAELYMSTQDPSAMSVQWWD
ncbi:hypothetical protein ACGFOU_36035 [Streptomyces sp. NPDC048595]|uniref:hypothetical protein n=1 Tax=Streptomyces sp. NPDC048595 TaxID=3365576 RepID=UPI00371629FC